MPKDHRLPERPKPPSIDQIMADIKAAGDDDVVFSGSKLNISRDSTPVTSLSLVDTEDMGHGDDSSVTRTESPDIGAKYLQTLELLNLVDLLKSTPEELKKQYEQLEELGAEVSEVINELKESASSTVKQKKTKS
ncbi:UPF0449 protein C19orf25 homolog [Gigantopelta aegis]|uniref:UPF0449 protein C19orf25 homolog n=1 Tax=Gigantopelta aegis TaxID=1735272 RepID=UPI001B888E39|nr:UPF0449 protein C19orf25 homolog [Gigantopelta aegis]